jgi:hypothetical protein
LEGGWLVQASLPTFIIRATDSFYECLGFLESIKMSDIHLRRKHVLSIQYLEDSPDLARLDRSSVVNRLRAAAAILPLNHLLIGWHVPQPLLEACALEAERLNLRFLRWQPLLTTDQAIRVDPSWHTKGLTGKPILGYRGLPEFTFLCPNHPALQDTVLAHLVDLLQQGLYQGFFFDRIRFPSPSVDPENDLACFCEHCRRKAARDGLDLDEIRRRILQLVRGKDGRLVLVKQLLSGPSGSVPPGQDPALDQMLAFRQRSIHDFLELTTQSLRVNNVEIGLDCFSPSLARMVGQDLHVLSRQVDWVKLMTYIRTQAPAGLPYELLGLFHYLVRSAGLTPPRALNMLRSETGLPLPKDQHRIETRGLSSKALVMEITRALKEISTPILAGIELVDLPGITSLRPAQIRADLAAVKRAHPAGLALSWDLIHISQDMLGLVRKAYFEEK